MDSSRCIDWAVQSTSGPACATFQGTPDERFSDHKGFWLRVPGPQVERRKGRLRPAPQWHKPAHLPKVEWERLLAQAWREEVAGSAAYAALTRSLRNEPSRSQQRVQKDWDAFMRCLALCFQRALRLVAAREGPEAKVAQEALSRPGAQAKGGLAKFQWVQEACRASGDPAQSEGLRRLRRQLARVHEVRRLSVAGREAPEGLLQRVWGPEASSVEALTPKARSEAAASLLADLKKQQEKLEQETKQRRLSEWRERMSTGTLADLVLGLSVNSLVPSGPPCIRMERRRTLAVRPPR